MPVSADTDISTRPTVLFVDDESMLLSSLQRLLRREPFTILLAVSAREAMEIMARTPVDVLVVDLQMPDIDGYELLSRVEVLHPQTVCLVMSAVADKEKVEEVVRHRHVFKFIAKPIHPDVLKRVIRDSVCRRSGGVEPPETIISPEHLMLCKEHLSKTEFTQAFNEKYVC